ncbi:MAG TPA: glycosyltransferase domain-containing protein, partial [Dehalococcoidia bacterium]
MRIAVYTSITGRKDHLKEEQNFQGADFIAFTDIHKPATGWQIREPCGDFADPNRNAKIHKVLAHKYLLDYDYSLWIDGTVRLVQPVEELIDRYLTHADLALFGHHARPSAYVEAETCIARKLDEPAIIRDQMERYQEL